MVLEGQGQEYAIDYMNSQELTEKIRKLEGLTDDERSALLELVNTQKRYGLVWEDKPEDVEEKLRDNLPVLTEVKERAIISDNLDAPNHILIEGDNLEALTALAYTHAGKVDVIYIDPPYNTGNKDFVYNDTFIDSDNAYRHSTWLSFMSKRLRIAKKLLSDRGVIFISIDDNEIAQLKMLCSEIFGSINFLQQIIIESNPRGSQSSKYFANTHEYLLVYSKLPYPDISFGLSKNEDDLSDYKYEDSRGRYRLLGLRQRGGAWRKEDRPFLHYPIYINPKTKAVSLNESEEFSVQVIPQRPSGELGRWTWSPQKVIKQISEVVGIIVNEGTDNEKWDVARKNYLTSEDGEVRLSKVKSLWIEKEINYQNGGSELKEIIGDGKFDYPKPLFLLNKILKCSTQKGAIILDFFAGSGTTMHAVMQLNAEDGGHRQCILVTNNENGICENVTYERNKRVINGYTKPNGQAVEGLHNNNLRYYKIEHTPRDASHSGKRKIFMALVDLLCFKEGIYKECDSFGSLSLAGKKQLLRYFSDKEGEMLLIYDSRVIPFVVKEIEKNPPAERPIKVYIFADGAYPYNEDFKQVGNSVELIAMPFAINQVLNRILPKKKDELLENELSEEEKEQMMAEAIAVEENEKAQEGLI